MHNVKKGKSWYLIEAIVTPRMTAGNSLYPYPSALY